MRRLEEDASGLDGLRTAVGDARDLDLDDASVDAVLLLGPRTRLYERFPHFRGRTPGVERTGVLPPLHPGSFCGFCHRPAQLRGELRDAGLTVAELVSVEGPAFLLGDLAERLDDPVARAVVLDTAGALEAIGRGNVVVEVAQAIDERSQQIDLLRRTPAWFGRWLADPALQVSGPGFGSGSAPSRDA